MWITKNREGYVVDKKKKYGNLTAREQREGRQGLRIMLIGAGAFVLFIIGMGAVLAVFDAVESSAVNDLYGETIARSCQPVPVGSMSIDHLPQAAPPRPLVLFTADSQRRHAWHDRLSTQWKAEDEASVVLVGCVAEDYVELETCRYTRTAAGGSETYSVRVIREQHTATVTLVNPADGRRIDALTLTGPEPAPCSSPDTEDSVPDRVRGTDLTWADFAVWVESYVLE
jgi:hypothetical protein